MVIVITVPKKEKNKKKTSFITRNAIISMVIIIAVAGSSGYYLWNNAIPANENFPVFATPYHIYITGIHTDQGYVYTEESTKQGKKSISNGIQDATIHIPKGTLIALDFINEDKDTGSDMDLNIDAFKVHTNSLKYFQAQTINFLADKDGTYVYYSKIHSEMKGTITVDP